MPRVPGRRVPQRIKGIDEAGYYKLARANEKRLGRVIRELQIRLEKLDLERDNLIMAGPDEEPLTNLKIKKINEKMNFARAEIKRLQTGKGKIPVLTAGD